MNYLIGTFHKTGSVWMMQLIHEFTQLTGKNFVTVAQRQIVNNDIKDSNGYVLFDYQSIFNDPLGLTANDLGFVIIRHPKDQIISATRYHAISSEEWLHQPIKSYGGKTYQEMINSLDTWEKKVVFEMLNASRYNTNSMANFKDKRFIKIRYEDLIDGYPEPESINLISDHLKFNRYEKKCFIKAYIKTHMNNNSNNHIINGSTGQWRNLWSNHLDEKYYKIYGAAEEKLGYI